MDPHKTHVCLQSALPMLDPRVITLSEPNVSCFLRGLVFCPSKHPQYRWSKWSAQRDTPFIHRMISYSLQYLSVCYVLSSFIYALYIYLINPWMERSHSSHSLWHTCDFGHGKKQTKHSIEHDPSSSRVVRAKNTIIHQKLLLLNHKCQYWLPGCQSNTKEVVLEYIQ